MSKKTSYSVVPDGAGCFLAMRLHAVATFLEEDLARDFANLKNGGADPGTYSVSAVDSEFFVLRNDKIALFYSEGLANEYVAMKEGRATPAVRAVSAPPPIDHDAIWAEAAAMVQGGR
jgi:hypothetical protein